MKDLKRYEFNSIDNNSVSYTVGFHEASTIEDAYIAVYLAIQKDTKPQPSEQKPPDGLIKAFDEMEAKAMLLKIVPKNCYWEDMENLTNTPIHYVLKAMQEYAQQSMKQERDRAIQECIEVAERELEDTDDHAGYVACDNIVKKLKEKLKSRQ